MSKSKLFIANKKIRFILVLSVCVFGMGVMASGASALKTPSAAGTKVLNNNKASIDASNASEGYIMVKYTGASDKKVKLIIEKTNGTQYIYNIKNRDQYEAFPLSEGKGTYKVNVYENVSGTKYAAAYGTSVTSEMEQDYLPFLYPNQFVDFTKDSKVVAKADEILAGKTDELDKVSEVYKYMVLNFSYDYAKAKTVQSDYIPDIDSILDSKKGICFDYASVMVAMLRSQGIPTKLIVGYAGTLYHAWISVYISDIGWIDNVIYFDGTQWKLMDPTSASTSSKGTAYKIEESKYSAKFAY